MPINNLTKFDSTDPKKDSLDLTKFDSDIKGDKVLSSPTTLTRDRSIDVDRSYLDKNIPFGTDLIEHRAAAQSTLDKWGHGIIKGISTFSTASGETLGAIGGGIVGGALTALGNDFDSDIVFKNPIVEFFSHVNDRVKERNPNYASQAEINSSVLSNMATANFWSDKFLDGLGFLASALVVGGGAAGIGAKTGLANLGKLGTGLNTFQAALVGRVGESAIEANDTYEQTVESLKEARKEGNNNYTDDEIESIAKDSRASTFG